MYLPDKDRINSEDLTAQQSRLEAAYRRKSQKVSVRYLSGWPSRREPQRATVRNLSGWPSRCEPPRAPVFKDVQMQK
jgi:hypothetical protein